MLSARPGRRCFPQDAVVAAWVSAASPAGPVRSPTRLSNFGRDLSCAPVVTTSRARNRLVRRRPVRAPDEARWRTGTTAPIRTDHTSANSRSAWLALPSASRTLIECHIECPCAWQGVKTAIHPGTLPSRVPISSLKIDPLPRQVVTGALNAAPKSELPAAARRAEGFAADLVAC